MTPYVVALCVVVFALLCGVGVVFVKALRRRKTEPPWPDYDDSWVLSPTKDGKARLVRDTGIYRASVTDWGSEFTGKYGSLPRYRWIVVGPDLDVTGLGNCASMREARERASAVIKSLEERRGA